MVSRTTGTAKARASRCVCSCIYVQGTKAGMNGKANGKVDAKNYEDKGEVKSPGAHNALRGETQHPNSYKSYL